MIEITSFGEWLRRRRQWLDLTQVALARAVGCAVVTIRKIEGDARRPSPQIARLLATALQIPLADQDVFLRAARGEFAAYRLKAPTVSADTPVTHSPLAAARLPVPLTPLIGRQAESTALTATLLDDQPQLLTVTGPGGVGKTRLALHVASMLQDHFPDGVHVVTLAAIREPAGLLNAVSQVVRLHEQPGDHPLIEQLIQHLRRRRLLLLLDNFEHLISAAPLLTTLRLACPGLFVLVTSREALRVQGEQVYPLAPLALPNPEIVQTPTAALEVDAIQLFVERAQAVQPSFLLTTDNVAAVAEICTRLDGIPLAIELAAARVKLLSPAELLQQMLSAPGARFDWLTQGRRDAPERHQTLRQTIDWSYYLLTPAEQTILRKLALFVGGCTLEAITAVCTGSVPTERLRSDNPLVGGEQQPQNSVDLVSGLTSLVDKSLVHQRTEQTEETRFWLLETIREYGIALLMARDELESLQQRHANYYVHYAELASVEFGGPQQALWFGRLALDAANLHAAYEWIVRNEAATLGLRLGAVLWRFWMGHGPVREGREKLAVLAALPGVRNQPQRLARVLLGLGELAEAHSDYPATHAALNEALSLARTVADNSSIIASLNALGKAHRAQGKYESARIHHEESMEIARVVGDELLVVECYHYLGKLSLIQGQLATAETLLHEALALANNVNSKVNVAVLLLNLAILARYRDDPPQARRYLEQSFALLQALDHQYSLGGYEQSELALVALAEADYATARQLLIQSLHQFVDSNHYWGIAQNLEFLALLAAVQGQAQRACTLAGAAATLRRVTHTAAYPDTTAKLKETLSALRTEIGTEVAEAARALGEAMTVEDAVAYATI